MLTVVWCSWLILTIVRQIRTVLSSDREDNSQDADRSTGLTLLVKLHAGSGNVNALGKRAWWVACSKSSAMNTAPEPHYVKLIPSQ